MTITQQDYTELVKKLLPPGPAWTVEPGLTSYQLAQAIAAFFYFTHQRLEQLDAEANPATSVETSGDYEAMLELPEPSQHDGYHASGRTFAERINAILSKMNRKGAPTVATYVKIAKLLGYDITIETADASYCGIFRCGDELGGTSDTQFIWLVNVAGTKVSYARAGLVACGDTLANFITATELECLFNRIKPAHTVCVFRYLEENP